VWNFFRPHALLVSLPVLLCLSSCGGSQTPPKFKPGDEVQISAERLCGQVVEVVGEEPPYRYVVRYMPPVQATNRDFRKDMFGEVELRLPEAKPCQGPPK
jgi:hypothetical protein